MKMRPTFSFLRCRIVTRNASNLCCKSRLEVDPNHLKALGHVSALPLGRLSAKGFRYSHAHTYKWFNKLIVNIFKTKLNNFKQ